MTGALALVAVAVWLSGRGRRPASRLHAAPRPVGAPVLHPGLLKVLGGGCVVVAAVIVLGPVRGVLVGVLATPVLALALDRLMSRATVALDLDGLPLTLDLLAAVLRRGQPLAPALAICAPVAGGSVAEQLARIAGLLRLGATPATAWQGVAKHPALGAVAVAACRSAESGIRLASGFERVAADLRADAKARGVARAERAAVWAMAPLGLCFLPAFVCTGVIPVVAGVARTAFSGLTG